jgi:glycerophosphoryl diester phosphodiesterase
MFKVWLQASSFWLQAAFMVFFSFTVSAQYSTPKFDVQGHRGARGLIPENTIPAFLMALDSGVTTIELDLVVTKDRKLVVSHEPWMHHRICLDPSGNAIIDSLQGMRANIFQMTYDEVKLWDCGSKVNARFPEQQKFKIAKPLLVDVIAAVETHIKSYSRYEVDYNIEIKTDPRGDNVYHPNPQEFSDLVINTLNDYLPMERVVIQSFDFRVLQYIHKQYPKIKLAALVENKKSIDDNLKELGFIPHIYSPDWKLLTADRVKYLHAKKVDAVKNGKKIRVIPWTVNQLKDMKALKKMGVDGIITDYPNRAKQL